MSHHSIRVGNCKQQGSARHLRLFCSSRCDGREDHPHQLPRAVWQRCGEAAGDKFNSGHARWPDPHRHWQDNKRKAGEQSPLKVTSITSIAPWVRLRVVGGPSINVQRGSVPIGGFARAKLGSRVTKLGSASGLTAGIIAQR